MNETLSVPTTEERTWSTLAHLSILLNLITGFLGILASLIIYLVYRDKSRYVAYQALQATLFQLVFWAGAGLLAGLVWGLTIPLLFIIVGFCMLPFAILISIVPVAAIVYGVIAGIQTGQGDDFQYWLVGRWVRGTLTGN